MKGKEKTMLEIRNIIHRLRLRQSHRRIHRELKVHRSTVRELYSLAVEHQWLDPVLPMPGDEEIMNARQCQTKPPLSHPLDLYREQIRQWDREGCSSVVIHRLLHEKCACDVQAIRRYRSKHFPKSIEPIMVRSTVPGRDLDLDFGELGKFLDDGEEVKKVWLFSLRLRHSRMAYREIVLDQTIPTFLMGHIHAFEYFNGVPSNCIPDNLKAAVVRPSIDNDGINRSYQELAEHYGFVVKPCLPYTPEHKGGVEGDIKYVKRNFLSCFLAKQWEANIKTPTIHDLTEALKKWEQEVANIHLIHGIERSPLEIFTSEEKQALRPLPSQRFEITVWRQCIVRRDWRIMVDSCYYSVPHCLIGKTVDVRLTHSLVRIFHNNQEVALHERATKKWDYKRRAEHAPPYKESVLCCSRDDLLALAQEIGPFTHQVAESILSHPSVDKLRPVRCLLGLSGKYPKERIERACERASICKIYSYKDREVVEMATAKKIVPFHRYRFERDPSDYKSDETFEERLEKLHPTSKHGNAMAGVFNALIADRVIDDCKNRIAAEKG
jgi:transposase